MPFRELVVLEEVAVVGNLALLQGPLQGPFAVAVFGQDRGVNVPHPSLPGGDIALGVHGAGGGLYALAVRRLGAPGVGGRRRSGEGERTQRRHCMAVEMDAKLSFGYWNLGTEAADNGDWSVAYPEYCAF